jgi:hypothetical protein
LNAASLNGTRLPAPESDTRAVALDIVPSELVESIEVKKTFVYAAAYVKSSGRGLWTT